MYVHYKIEIADLHAHLFRVTLTLPRPQPQQRLSLPVWIPGSYMVREFSRHLIGLQARQGRRFVELRQLDKCSWAADCRGRSDLVLSYEVYAFDTSVREAYLDAQRGFFNGTGLCLRAEGHEHLPHRIELARLPASWRVASAMPQLQDGLFEAQDYDELLDHPFELGQFWRGQFEVRGVAHELVVAGAMPSFDAPRLLADTQRLCEAQIDFWHGKPARGSGGRRAPFERYVFMLNAVDDGYGGLEHRASTALIAARRDLPQLGQREMSNSYARLLGLISHEYFHSWNVKRLRPDAFAQFDYGRENYTELLWFFEGFTSYYDELFLARTGLIDEARYLKSLATMFSGVLNTPGVYKMSVAQSSFEAWTKYYRQDENSPNAIVSYYAKGAMIALALDLHLRSHHGASLDQLMRQLWARSDGGPISEADILGSLRELADPACADLLQGWVHGTGELPLPALFEPFGVRWEHESPNLVQRLGIKLSEGSQGIHVKQVLQGSAAMQAGLSAGDEILACNGWRLKRFEEAVLTLGGAAQARLHLLVVRDQRVLSLDVLLPKAEEVGRPIQLRLADTQVARASSLRRAWLAP